MPDLLLDVRAHVASYEPILKQWEDGNYAQHTSPINFPSEELLAYSEKRVRYLKGEQRLLLQQTASRHS